jgi:fructosamine-3-kinase
MIDQVDLPIDISDYSRIEEGMNICYEVKETNGNRYIIKFDTNTRNLNFRAEPECSKLVRDKVGDIAPEVVYYKEDKIDYYIMEKVEGAPYSKLSDNEYLKYSPIVANTASDLWNIEFQSGGVLKLDKDNNIYPDKSWRWVMEDRIDEWSNYAQKNGFIDDISPFEKIISQEMPEYDRFVFNHGDIWEENIYLSGEDIMFIDWGDSYSAPPEFDVATMMALFSNPPRRRDMEPEIFENILSSININLRSSELSRYFIYQLLHEAAGFEYWYRDVTENKKKKRRRNLMGLLSTPYDTYYDYINIFEKFI